MQLDFFFSKKLESSNQIQMQHNGCYAASFIIKIVINVKFNTILLQMEDICLSDLIFIKSIGLNLIKFNILKK